MSIGEQYRAAWNASARHSAREAILTAQDGSETPEECFDRMGKADADMLRAFVTPESVVLDIGCGIGRIEKHLAPHCAKMHAVDVADEMIAEAKRWTRGVANIEFHRAAGADLAFLPSDSIDFAFSCLVLQHMEYEDAYRTLCEVARVLRPDGRGFFQFPSFDSPLYANDFVKQADADPRSLSRARPYTVDLAARLITLAGLTVEKTEQGSAGTMTEHEIVIHVQRPTAEQTAS